MIIAVWTKLVGLLEPCHIFPERPLALLAQERHLDRLLELMVLDLGMTFGALRVDRGSARVLGGRLGEQNQALGARMRGRDSRRTTSCNTAREWQPGR